MQSCGCIAAERRCVRDEGGVLTRAPIRACWQAEIVASEATCPPKPRNPLFHKYLWHTLSFRPYFSLLLCVNLLSQKASLWSESPAQEERPQSRILKLLWRAVASALNLLKLT